MAKIGDYIIVDVVVAKEGNLYSSWCPELDIASCGDDPNEAAENLRDAIELYLNTLGEEGECARILKARGIQILRLPDDNPVIPTSFVTQYRQKIPARV